jgi:hypothetical protein
LISLVASLPAVLLVFASPVAGQNSLFYTSWIEFETVALRSLTFLVPMGLIALQRRDVRRSAPMLVVAVLVLGQILTIPFSGMAAGWSALDRQPTRTMTTLTQSSDFVHGATYRVLTFGDAKYGQYSIVRAGGRLDSEFFPESMNRRSFRDERTYAQFLTKRQVDYVVVDPRYRRFKTNEQQLLDTLAASGPQCVDGVAVREVEQTTGFRLYAVSRNCSS